MPGPSADGAEARPCSGLLLCVPAILNSAAPKPCSRLLRSPVRSARAAHSLAHWRGTAFAVLNQTPTPATTSRPLRAQLVFNPKDTNTFASASLDRTIKVWSLGNPTPNMTLEGHEKGVNCIDYYSGGCCARRPVRPAPCHLNRSMCSAKAQRVCSGSWPSAAASCFDTRSESWEVYVLGAAKSRAAQQVVHMSSVVPCMPCTVCHPPAAAGLVTNAACFVGCTYL